MNLQEKSQKFTRRKSYIYNKKIINFRKKCKFTTKSYTFTRKNVLNLLERFKHSAYLLKIQDAFQSLVICCRTRHLLAGQEADLDFKSL